MRITRLLLQNYRVFEDQIELALPAGLVGIYGPNGAGKSALIESIRWTLWGQARTAKDEVRTAGVNAECLTEVEFEHEGHLYVVRRTIAGANHTVRAEAHWNGQQVADGVRDVAAYVHSVLGMDDQSFRASVFAEQKQVAAFSSQSPQKRRDLVMRLLGITPIDRARDGARADARDAKADHERLSVRLPDIEALAASAADAAALRAAAEERAEAAAARLGEAAAAVSEAEAAYDQVDELGREYDQLVTEGKGVAIQVAELADRIERLEAERDELAAAARRRDELEAASRGIEDLDLRARQLAELSEARRRAAGVEVPAEPPPAPDTAAAVDAAAVSERAAAVASALAGEIRGLDGELARARAAAERSGELSPHEDCPVCGQALGDAFEAVQQHRADEVAAADQRLTDARARLAAATSEAKAAAAAAARASAAFERAAEAHRGWEQLAARRAELDRAADELAATIDPPPPVELADLDDECRQVATLLASARQAADDLARIEGRLERVGAVAAELADASERRAEASSRRETLLEKVKSLGFAPDQLVAARTRREETRSAHGRLAGLAEEARVALAQATSAAELAASRLDDGRARHSEIHELAERSRHLGRVADLLSDFRNNVVAVVGPRLAAQAADLFAELTDHEYDRLEVNADTYEIQISDQGRVFGLDRFSGSETDLANLALRVAISEHVRFQSGGAVGLLVLDEVFGPLDEERKARMLLALDRLGSRFRQVLVVTHDPEIKEQLPGAIQVVKLPGRRATARVLTGM